MGGREWTRFWFFFFCVRAMNWFFLLGGAVDYGEGVVEVWGPLVRWGPLIVASTREGTHERRVCLCFVFLFVCVFFGSYETVAEQNWVSREVNEGTRIFLMLSLRASQPHPSSCTAKPIITTLPFFLSLGIACVWGALYITSPTPVVSITITSLLCMTS